VNSKYIHGEQFTKWPAALVRSGDCSAWSGSANERQLRLRRAYP